MDNNTYHARLREFCESAGCYPEFDRIAHNYKLYIERSQDFRTWLANQQPIETSENEAFDCKWQGQTTPDKIIGQLNVINAANEMFKPKPTKEQLWQQVQAIEQVIAVLRREQNTLHNQIENYE